MIWPFNLNAGHLAHPFIRSLEIHTESKIGRVKAEVALKVLKLSPITTEENI